MKKIYDAHGGVLSIIEHDRETDKTTLATIQTPQSTQAILESNKRKRSHGRTQSPELGLRPMATIPHGLAMQWVREAGINQADFWNNEKWSAKERNAFFRRRYMDSDYRDLRTSEWQ